MQKDQIVWTKLCNNFEDIENGLEEKENAIPSVQASEHAGITYDFVRAKIALI